VLVVCTGNLCRSPLVEALLRRDLEQAGIEATVTSAGVGAPVDQQPDKKLIRVADELGVDVRQHRSRRITPQQVRDADLILTMTREHARVLRTLDPAAADRTVPLRVAAWKARAVAREPLPLAEWASRLAADVPEAERPRSSRADDVPDPIGRPLRHYRRMGEDVSDLVRVIVRHWSGRSSP
jgi:protein-tyrosine phosphatase